MHFGGTSSIATAKHCKAEVCKTDKCEFGHYLLPGIYFKKWRKKTGASGEKKQSLE
jgi:hypothetical protein